jgi:HD superfamily phosphohydrolase
MAYASAGIGRHLSLLHSEANLVVAKDKMAAVVKHHSLCDTYTPMENYAQTAFEGLEQHDGFGCLSCAQSYTSEKHMKSHVSKQHTVVSGKGYAPAILQRYNNGEHNQYWRCKETELHEHMDLDDNLAQFRELNQAMINDIRQPKNYNVNARLVDPFLLATKWHELVEGLDTAQVKSWVRPADRKTWEVQLSHHVIQYLDSSLAAPMNETDLMILNSPTPYKECVQSNATKHA